MSSTDSSHSSAKVQSNAAVGIARAPANAVEISGGLIDAVGRESQAESITSYSVRRAGRNLMPC